jgi:hypothetical protein
MVNCLQAVDSGWALPVDGRPDGGTAAFQNHIMDEMSQRFFRSMSERNTYLP